MGNILSLYFLASYWYIFENLPNGIPSNKPLPESNEMQQIFRGALYNYPKNFTSFSIIYLDFSSTVCSFGKITKGIEVVDAPKDRNYKIINCGFLLKNNE